MSISKHIGITIPNSIPNSFFDLISRKAGRLVLQHFISNYSKQGAEDSKGNFIRWRDRSKKNKSEKPLLFDTGAMKSAFKLSTGSHGFTIENTMPYAQYHQFGTLNQDGSERLPVREILYHSPEVNKIIIKVIDEEIMKLLNL